MFAVQTIGAFSEADPGMLPLSGGAYKVCKYAIRFWRSVRERTEIIILVVWTLLVGFWSHLSRLSVVHMMFASLRPGE
jgi:hypothetical protein